MKQQAKIEDLSPSFSCYSSDSLTSMAVAKVISEEQNASAPFNEFGDIEEGDFEFSLMLKDDEEIDSRGGWTVFPIFNRDLLLNDEFKAKDDDEIDVSCSSSITFSLRKLFINEQRKESSSYSSRSSSSEEADELDNQPSGTFGVWRSKKEGRWSPRCKKSSSTGGSGLKKWIGIRNLLRRSNSEGNDPIVLLTPKQKQNSGKVSKVVGMFKGKTTVYEQFYVQRRAENEAGKKKTYLPYRHDLVGLFSNVNGMGKCFHSKQ